MDFVTGILRLIPHIIIIIAVIMYVSKKSTPEGTLMLIGAILNVLMSIIYSIVIPFVAKINEYDSISPYLIILSLVGIIGSLFFAIGLLLLIRKNIMDIK